MNPILKIKTGTQRPPNYSTTLITPTDGSPSYYKQNGLSGGELGVNLTNYAFYIGNNAGVAITFGAEVDSNSALGTSDYKIPTQKAVKDYISTFACPPVDVATQIATWRKTSNQSINTYLSTNPNLAIASVLFNEQDANNTTTGGINNLSYSSTSGIFTYSSSATTNISLLVIYQITWSLFTSSQNYASNTIIRSAWIQKNPLIPTGSPLGSWGADTDKYGFTTALLPPLQSSSVGAITGTQIGSAVIILQPGQQFSIQVKNHSTVGPSPIVVNASSTLSGTAPTTIANDATRVQVIRI